MSDPLFSVRYQVVLFTGGSRGWSFYTATNSWSVKASDLFKFVLTGREDYEWSVAFCRDHRLTEQVQVLFSPVHGALAPRDLADWILADGLQVRLQVQLHKLLWGEERGR